MQEYSFLVPMSRDDTKAVHHTDNWDWLHSELLTVIGGYTYSAPHYGCWTDSNGNVIHDVSREYKVAVDSNFKLDKLVGLLCEAKEKFGQQCFYLSKTSDSVQLV